MNDIGFLLILSIRWREETSLSSDPNSTVWKRLEGPSVAAHVWLVIDTCKSLCTALYGDETASTLSLELSGARQSWCVQLWTSKSRRFFFKCDRRADGLVDARVSLRRCCYPGRFFCKPSTK